MRTSSVVWVRIVKIITQILLYYLFAKGGHLLISVGLTTSVVRRKSTFLKLLSQI